MFFVGVQSLGIIGGGAVLAVGTAAGGFGLLGGIPGIYGLAGVGSAAVAAMGLGTRAMCMVPFCRTQLGQCCLLIASFNGLRCPISC